jgi:hypothetical protein
MCKYLGTGKKINMLASAQKDTIRLARCLIRDAATNWARDELAASPEDVCNQLSDMVGERYDFETGNVIPEKKLVLFKDTVLRKDYEGNLFLMNRRDTGWNSSSIPIKNINYLLARFSVKLYVGEWQTDKFGEYCSVTKI